MKYISYIKSGILSVLSITIVLTSFWACDDKDYEKLLEEHFIISEIEINKTMDPLPLLMGRDTLLTYTASPDNATDPSVVWTSGDNTIATVDEEGRIKALKEGSVFITVAPKVGYATSSTIEIRVIDKVIYTESIQITNTELEVYETDQLQLQTATVPENVTYFAVKWTSENEAIAKVSDNGVVTGVKEGTVKITATATDGTNKSATTTITVKPLIPVEDVEISPAITELAKYEMAKLEFTVTPANATAASLNWSSSNNDVLTVDNGYLKVNGSGSVTLTATAEYADGSSIEKGFKITIPEGKVNDTFQYQNLWIPRSGNAVTEVKNNKLYVTSVAQDATQFKMQFERSVYTDLNPSNYEILAFKVNLTGLASGNAPNYVLDVWGGDISGGKYTLNGSHRNNAMERETTPDGSVVHFVRLNSASGGLFGSNSLEDNKTSVVQHIIFEIWEMKSATSNPPVLEMSWVKTFKNVGELKSYIDNE